MSPPRRPSMSLRRLGTTSPHWLDGWYRLRDRLLSNPRFQRWAAVFPLTRPFAQRRAAALFDLCAGFVYTQILTAGVRLGVFEQLAEGPRTAKELARATSLSEEAARRLLDGLVAVRLVEDRGRERYGLAVLGAALLGNPAVSRMIDHNGLLYSDLEDPVALLRGDRTDTKIGAFWAYATRDSRGITETQVSEYSALMATTQSLIAEDIIEAYPLHRHRCLLDVAGGEGAFLETVGQHVPGLELQLFDLPPVADRARARLQAAGFENRSRVEGGDVFRDPLPRGADIVSLVRVLHDHDDDDVLRILAAVRGALAPGGTLLIAEPMSRTRGAETVGDAYFGFYLLAMGKGRPRPAERLESMLRAAGFTQIRRIPTRRPFLTAVLTARM